MDLTESLLTGLARHARPSPLSTWSTRLPGMGHELPSPTFDRRRNVAEGPAGRRQLVPDPYRRTPIDPTYDETTRLEVLQPSREDLVAHAVRLVAQLVEPQGAVLEQPEDEPRPRPTENGDGGLKSLAVGVDRPCHLPQRNTSQRKAP